MGDIIAIFKTGIGLAKDSPFKLVIILAIVVSVIGFWQYQLHSAYQRGRAELLVEIQKGQAKERERLAKKHAKELDSVTHDLNESKAKALELMNELDKKPKVIYRDVVKVVEVMDCKRLGDAGLQLWKLATEKPAGIERRSGE